VIDASFAAGPGAATIMAGGSGIASGAAGILAMGGADAGVMASVATAIDRPGLRSPHSKVIGATLAGRVSAAEAG
jgi:hypothetical protein